MVDSTLTPEWRLIPGFPDYEVSDQGIVRRAVAHPRRPNDYPAGYVMAVWTTKRKVARKDGHVTDLSYLAVTLTDRERGTKKHLLVHRAVAYAFIGPQPSPKHQIAHRDGDRTNNRASNLRWATGIENQDDRIVHGTSNRGSRHGMSKLTEADVRAIRARGAAGERACDIARDYPINSDSTAALLRGTTWKHLE